jgi:DNA-binding IscR family transcriptional regulator
MCWAAALYSGPNGPQHCRNRNAGVRLREVMEAVEDSVPHGSCILQNHSEVGRNCSACPVLAALARAHRRALEELDSITIEELARAVVPGETPTLGERGRSAPEPAHQPVGS